MKENVFGVIEVTKEDRTNANTANASKSTVVTELTLGECMEI